MLIADSIQVVLDSYNNPMQSVAEDVEYEDVSEERVETSNNE